jgi:hypothetical protein
MQCAHYKRILCFSLNTSWLFALIGDFKCINIDIILHGLQKYIRRKAQKMNEH